MKRTPAKRKGLQQIINAEHKQCRDAQASILRFNTLNGDIWAICIFQETSVLQASYHHYRPTTALRDLSAGRCACTKPLVPAASATRRAEGLSRSAALAPDRVGGTCFMVFLCCRPFWADDWGLSHRQTGGSHEGGEDHPAASADDRRHGNSRAMREDAERAHPMHQAFRGFSGALARYRHAG